MLRSPTILVVAPLILALAPYVADADNFLENPIFGGAADFLVIRSREQPSCDCPLRWYSPANKAKDCDDLKTLCLCWQADFSTVECDYGLCCSTARRNLLTEDAIEVAPGSHADDESYQNALERCGMKSYDAKLYVDGTGHLFALASPSQTESDCPYVATHSLYGDNNGGGIGLARKQLLLWNSVATGESKFPELETRAFPMGTFSLHELARAYEQAPAGSSMSSTDGKISEAHLYDAIANNCGHYMMNLSSQLGIKIDTQITSFVARRLLADTGKRFADKIRNSANFPSLFPSEESGHHRRLGISTSVSDEQVIEALVRAQSGL